MDELNEGQRRICDIASGHILVIAGPGTGKTHSITKKIAQLIKEGTEPSSIICITFTNRAACELKERISRVIQEDTKGIFIGTIHKLGLMLLKEFMGTEIRIIDRDAQMEILKEILKDEKRARSELRKIQRIKNQMLFNQIHPVYQMYQNRLKEEGLFDYEDLIIVPQKILEGVMWKNRIKHIIVDEFQDLNRAQYEFIRRIANIHSSFLCAVGDADQSIYGFRGSDVSIFLDFQKFYPECEIIRLSENYRSTKTIIEASTQLIRNNKYRFDNVLIARRENSLPIKLVTVAYPWMTGDFIVQEIEKRIGGSTHLKALNRKSESERREVGFSDFAVIYRTREEALQIKKSFEKSGIPYQIIGGKLEDSSNSLRGLIDDTKKVLLETEDETLRRLNPQEFFKRYPLLRKNTVLISLIENLFASTPMDELLDDLILLDPSDDYNPYSDSVTLTTIHRAKGLEFSCVFIVGLDDGYIPLSRAKDYDVEEERRLLYVGMTRAKDELFLIHAENRPPSPFLKEIPQDLIERISVKRLKKQKKTGLFEFST